MTNVKSLTVTCGNHRHPQQIPVSWVASVSDDDLGAVTCAPESAFLTLKPRHWIQDTWGDGKWHGYVAADRADVGALIFKARW